MTKNLPLVYKGVPAETLASLFCDGIAYEPWGSAAHKVLVALAEGKDQEKMAMLFSALPEWQREKIIGITNALEGRLQAKRILEARLKEARRRAWLAEANSGMQKLPIRMVGITEKCNRGCLHCGVLAGMGLGTMPYKDFERYLGLIFPKTELVFSYGEPLLYSDGGKDIGDAVSLALERFPHITVGIVTSGIRTPTEMRACEKLARLGDFDKTRILITLSVRSFMGDVEHAGRTLKFFVENGIRIAPRICGIPAVRRNGGWKRDASYERGKVLADLVAGFGIRPEDAMKLPTGIHCKRAIHYMGRMATSRKRIGQAMEDYFGNGSKGSQIVVVRWDSRGSICDNTEFGLMPDGSIIPGCCHMVSNFMKIGSLKGANQDSINEITDQMKKDARGMLAAARKGDRANSCIPCVNWFKERDREGGCAGIRDAKRFMKAIPTSSAMKRLRRIKEPIPSSFI